MLKNAFLSLVVLSGCATSGKTVSPAAEATSGAVETQAETAVTHVQSKDGTNIAFEAAGEGPALVIVGGALSHRGGAKPLANALSETFTVYVYDRRGRGDSSDTLPYAVDREIEDLEAVIDRAGGHAYVYGVSSGAALSLQAAAKLGSSKIPKLAIYEPPYGQDADEFNEQKAQVNRLVKTGAPGEAAAYFLAAVGTPPAALEDMQRSAEWKTIAQIDFTLVYDYTVLGNGSVPDSVATIGVPTLVMNGDQSLDFMPSTADHIAELVPDAERKTLAGQTHQAAPEVVAPVLIQFFR